MASSAQHKFSLINEVTFGVTPAVTPAFLLKGITGTTLALAKGAIESETIRNDRQVSDVRHGNRQVGGDMSFELNYDGFSDVLEALLCGTWTDNVLVPGVTRRSFSAMRHFSDLADGAAKPYHLYKGVEFNTLSLTVAPEALVKATVGCLGRDVVFLEGAPVGATFTAPSTKTAFDSFSGSVLINETESTIVTEVQLNLENGLDPRFAVGEDRSNGRAKIGRTRVTGSLGLYFETSALLTAFSNAEHLSLSLSLTDHAGNSLLIELPRILGTGGQPDVSGEDDVVITFPFSALFTDGDTPVPALSITRTPA